MKKYFKFFLLAMLVLTSCQRGNTVTVIIDKECYKEVQENVEDIDSFLKDYFVVDMLCVSDIKPIAIEIHKRKITLRYNQPLSFLDVQRCEQIQISESVEELRISNSKHFKKIKILESVTSLSLECESLKKVKIPESVTSLYLYSKALKKVKIPESVTSLSLICESLKKVKIPESVTSLSLHSKALKKVKIPNSVTKIGFEAFARCTSLKSIEIPNSVTEIGEYAFYGCTSLKKVRISRNADFKHNSFPEGIEIIEY